MGTPIRMNSDFMILQETDERAGVRGNAMQVEIGKIYEEP